MDSIVLIGGGGHCGVVIDVLNKCKELAIYGIVDSKLTKDDSLLGYPVIGGDDILPKLFTAGIRKAFIAVGSVGNCDVRKRIYDNLNKIGFEMPAIVHPQAIVAQDVIIGKGVFIAAGAVIGPRVKIGNNAIINTSSSIDHDCCISDFVHIAPGVTLCGGVKVGQETHIGVGAKVVQYINIGNNCMIKAGVIVKRDVVDSQVVGSEEVNQNDRNE